METENEEFTMESDEDILNMIKLKPELLTTNIYIQERFNKIIIMLKACDDKQYFRLPNVELIKLLRSKPEEIKNIYIQQKILKIFLGNKIINIL